MKDLWKTGLVFRWDKGMLLGDFAKPKAILIFWHLIPQGKLTACMATWRIHDLGQAGPAELWPQGGPGSKICSKTAWFWRNLGGEGAPRLPGPPWIHYWAMPLCFVKTCQVRFPHQLTMSLAPTDLCAWNNDMMIFFKLTNHKRKVPEKIRENLVHCILVSFCSDSQRYNLHVYEAGDFYYLISSSRRIYQVKKLFFSFPWSPTGISKLFSKLSRTQAKV